MIVELLEIDDTVVVIVPDEVRKEAGLAIGTMMRVVPSDRCLVLEPLPSDSSPDAEDEARWAAIADRAHAAFGVNSDQQFVSI